MEQKFSSPANKRFAVVTGANKGIGFEICKQLASEGVTVVLTSRDVKRGLDAVEKLRLSGLSDLIVFHQLDVTDPTSIASLSAFIKTQFGKLDILVNNAGIGGVVIDPEALRRATELAGGWPNPDRFNWKEIITDQNYELAESCLKTNFYGAKRMTEAALPLLQLSDSAKIVNVSSFLGLLKHIPNERLRAVLNDVESLTEEKIDDLLNEFLKDFKEGMLETKGWPSSAYVMAKAAMNAYTRILAKKHPSICINAVCPGYVKTDINGGNGFLTPAEGAEFAVRLALLPEGGPSGLYFNQKDESCF